MAWYPLRENMRVCTKCGESKENSEFYRYFEKKFHAFRIKAVCKACQREFHRKWNINRRGIKNAYAVRWGKKFRENPANHERLKVYSLASRKKLMLNLAQLKKTDPEKYRRIQLNKHMRRNFGVGIDVYDRLLKEQDGRCGMCKCLPTNERRLDVDHDHATGKVRGLLCNPCNKTLHYVEEHAWRIKLGRKYLEQTQNPAMPEMWLPLGEPDESYSVRTVS